jgi:hypothetical protein
MSPLPTHIADCNLSRWKYSSYHSICKFSKATHHSKQHNLYLRSSSMQVLTITDTNHPSTPSGQKLEYLAGRFAAMRSGKTLKGSKHSGGFPTPPDDKNPRRPTLISVRVEY